MFQIVQNSADAAHMHTHTPMYIYVPGLKKVLMNSSPGKRRLGLATQYLRSIASVESSTGMRLLGLATQSMRSVAAVELSTGMRHLGLTTRSL